MAKKTLDELVNSLYKAADKVTPTLRDAFLSAIAEIQENLISIEEIELALSSQSIDAVIAATQIDKLDDLLFGIGLNNNAYVFTTQLNAAFVSGAINAINNLSQAQQAKVAFNELGYRAVENMRSNGMQAVRDITASSKDGIVSVIERAILDGTNPNKAAKEIRQFVGLTKPQAQAVINFKRQLEQQKILGLTPPDKRRLNAIEQSVVRRHMKEGNLTQAKIDELVETYKQRLINKRAIDIARTEALSAVNEGQLELWNQAVDLGVIDNNFYRKFWIVTPDDRLRATHAAIPNMNPNGVKVNAKFITPFGMVSSPGDRNVNLINCRCVLVLGEFGDVLTY